MNEKKLRNIIKENIRQMLNEAESGGWVVETDEAEKAYELAASAWGNDELNRAIVRAMSNETLAQILAYLFRMYDFREWKNRDEREDNELYESEIDKKKEYIISYITKHGDYDAVLVMATDNEDAKEKALKKYFNIDTIVSIKEFTPKSDDELLEGKLNEYEGMDDSWSPVAVFGENQRDIYNMLWQIKLALQKKIKRGVEIRKDILANSSVIHRAAQISLKRFNEYNKENEIAPFYMDNAAKRGLREYYAQKILDWIDEEKINNQPKSEDEVINETLKRIFKNIKNR